MSMTESSVPAPAPNFEWTHAPFGRVLVCRALQHFAHHCFTGRELRLRGEEGESDWARVASFFGLSAPSMRRLDQVHGCRAVVVSGAAQVDGPSDASDRLPQADALVSDRCDVALAVKVADCVPVLLAATWSRDTHSAVPEPVTRAIAAVHAGWRGAAAGVLRSAVLALADGFGVHSTEMIAAIGPSIGPCHYEVGEDTRNAFAAAGHDETLLQRWFTRDTNGRYRLDLWRTCRDQLEGLGVAPANIHVAELCTVCHADVFYSFRREGVTTGRLLGVIRRCCKREY
jgi:polyphenol oxidase